MKNPIKITKTGMPPPRTRFRKRLRRRIRNQIYNRFDTAYLVLFDTAYLVHYLIFIIDCGNNPRFHRCGGSMRFITEMEVLANQKTAAEATVSENSIMQRTVPGVFEHSDN